MGRELAFVLINPYTIAKSRTGGVIARYLARTDLGFVAARMFGPGAELVEKYAQLIRRVEPNSATCALISDYILRAYAPDPATGRARRVMLLLFEGEDAVRKIWTVTGSATLKSGSGETIRDTYGDYVVDAHNNVTYFEPAVLVSPTKERASATLHLWAKHTESCGGVVGGAADVPAGQSVQKTVVLLKPDNFRQRTSRPGSIIDILSSSGLRIVGVKKFAMSVEQAEEFYAPVRETLTRKFRELGASRAAEALGKEFGFAVPEQIMNTVCTQLAPLFAGEQFESIIQFMTGHRPSQCKDREKHVPGKEECFALVYDGPNAVGKIRNLLGPTDPSKARPGSVRREFGSDIMVNAAHASDSEQNALREMEIINFEEDTIRDWVDRYYGSVFSKVAAVAAIGHGEKYRFRKRLKRVRQAREA